MNFSEICTQVCAAAASGHHAVLEVLAPASSVSVRRKAIGYAIAAGTVPQLSVSSPELFGQSAHLTAEAENSDDGVLTPETPLETPPCFQHTDVSSTSATCSQCYRWIAHLACSACSWRDEGIVGAPPARSASALVPRPVRLLFDKDFRDAPRHALAGALIAAVVEDAVAASRAAHTALQLPAEVRDGIYRSKINPWMVEKLKKLL